MRRDILSIMVMGIAFLTAQVNLSGQETKKQPVSVGDEAPDFELVGLDNNKIKLSDRFGKKGRPVVLLFSRASW